MTDHHAEYEAAARRKSADAMVADVRHMRDRYALARRSAGRRADRAWHAGRYGTYDLAEIRRTQHAAVVIALDGLLRKWGRGDG